MSDGMTRREVLKTAVASPIVCGRFFPCTKTRSAKPKCDRRVGLTEMTRHEFLDQNYRKERTTFADGTTVTVDWNTNTFAINPALEQETLTWQSCQKPARQQGLGCPP